MRINIKKYDIKDEKQLKKLLDLSFEDDDLLYTVKGPNLQFAYAAFAEKELAGAAFGWVSNFHPYCTYFRILSNPFYGMHDVEEKLLFGVEHHKKIDSPLQTSIWETSISVGNALVRNGFKEIRRTYMPILQISDFKSETPFSYNNNHIVKTLAEVSLNNELMEKLVLIVKRNYEEAHKLNPVVNAGLDDWKKLILANDVILNGSYVFLTGGMDVAAYSFLHKSDSEKSYELGWCGCLDKRYKALIPQLMHHHIKYATNQKVETIVGEFDTTDCYAMEALKTFPFAPCPTWITYQKK